MFCRHLRIILFQIIQSSGRLFPIKENEKGLTPKNEKDSPVPHRIHGVKAKDRVKERGM